jgi:hypothetical protein
VGWSALDVHVENRLARRRAGHDARVHPREERIAEKDLEALAQDLDVERPFIVAGEAASDVALVEAIQPAQAHGNEPPFHDAIREQSRSGHGFEHRARAHVTPLYIEARDRLAQLLDFGRTRAPADKRPCNRIEVGRGNRAVSGECHALDGDARIAHGGRLHRRRNGRKDECARRWHEPRPLRLDRWLGCAGVRRPGEGDRSNAAAKRRFPQFLQASLEETGSARASAAISASSSSRRKPRAEDGIPPLPADESELPPLTSQSPRPRPPPSSTLALMGVRPAETSSAGVVMVMAPLTPVGAAAWITFRPKIPDGNRAIASHRRGACRPRG